MTPPDLSQYIRNALKAGHTKDEIRTTLQAADWTETEIETALAGWMTSADGDTIPRPIRSSAARDALFYALLFVVFGMVAGNTLTLLFAQINLWLPDPGARQSYSGLSGLRWSMAALIVFVPVFWWIDRKDRHAGKTDPARRHGTVRRWLSAIAMLLAVITLLGDALYLIFNWLDGQITPRFVVKSATVGGMAVIVLTYFREDRDLPLARMPLPAAWVLITLAGVALILSFRAVGGPAQGQIEQRDQWRISDLHRLTEDIRACPGIDLSNLPDVLDPMSCASNPERLTGFASAISYQRISATDYMLCTEVEFPLAIEDHGLRITGNTVCRPGQRN